MIKKLSNTISKSLSDSTKGHFYSVFMSLYLAYRNLSKYK